MSTLQFSVLASGSSGNCTWLASESTGILIDAGLSARQIANRLAEAGGCMEQVQAVCVSHEHQDHTVGLRVLHKRHGIPLYANAGTVDALSREPQLAALPWKLFSTGYAFTVGDLSIEPFSVPHDALDPVGFVIACGTLRVGVVTDMGMATALIRERLRHCQAIVIESNHDEVLLQNADRPWSLKQRIRGRQGHLSNQAAANLLKEISSPVLRHVFLAHLSEDCNRQDLALDSATRALAESGHSHVEVRLGYPDRISGPCRILTVENGAGTSVDRVIPQRPAEVGVVSQGP